jgi:hypothetical protein
MNNDNDNWFLTPDDNDPSWFETILIVLLFLLATLCWPFFTDYFKRHAALWTVTIALALLFGYAFWSAL